MSSPGRRLTRARGYLEPGTHALTTSGRTCVVMAVKRDKGEAWYEVRFPDGTFDRIPIYERLKPLNLDDPDDLEEWLNAP